MAIASHAELIDYGKLRGVDELRGHFTTVQAVEREIRTIKAWMQGQGQAIPILEREAAAQAQRRYSSKRASVAPSSVCWLLIISTRLFTVFLG